MNDRVPGPKRADIGQGGAKIEGNERPLPEEKGKQKMGAIKVIRWADDPGGKEA